MKLPLGRAQAAHIDGELLSGYLDNQVPPLERQRVDEHLRACPECRAELNSMRQTVALLHAMPRVPVPRPFTLTQAQVGARGPAPAPWFWGAARALGAVAALVVVAVLAVLVMRPGGQGALPAGQVALKPQAPSQAPAAAPAAPTMEAAQPSLAAPAPAAQPPSAAPSGASQSQPAPLTDQAREATASATTRNPTATPPARASAPAKQAPATTAPAAAAAAAPRAAATAAPLAAAPTRTAAPTAAARAAAPAAAAPTAAPTAQPPSTLALGSGVQPSSEPGARSFAAPATPVAPLGLGGGGPADGVPGIVATPPPLPPTASLSAVLPSTAGIVYADRKSLVAIDNRGARTLAQTPGIDVPLISFDRSWVAYRVQNDSSASIWVVRWNASDAHQVVSETAFPGYETLTGADGVHVIEARWVPGGHTLALLVAVPDPTSHGAAPTNELWMASADGNGLRSVLQMDPSNYSYSFSPDGKTIAVLERGTPEDGTGRILLYNIDGSNKRTVLEFAANIKGYGYESQLAWLPDSSALLAAIPDADANFGTNAGLSLYRIPVQTGQSALRPIGHISAQDSYWSPDGKVLAFGQSAAGDSATVILNVANADGSNAQPYATAFAARFVGWSTDNQHILYFGDGQLYLGGQDGEAPRTLGAEIAIYQPHWTAANQAVYLLDQGSTWALVSYTLDGKTVSLGVMLPKDATVDMTTR